MTTSAPIDRNDRIYDLLAGFLNDAPEEPRFTAPFTAEEVEILFTTPYWGHREIVLTILLTKLVYPDFKPSVDLYQHHPRSVYEKPIRKALREFGIPHKKSGPLNVAKNINRLNVDWATGKREERVAMAVVGIVDKVEQVSAEDLQQFTAAYITRYKQEAARVKDLEVVLAPQENPIFIAGLCTDLINNVPDGGATAQFIVGLLMEISKIARASNVTVTGYLDSVSATNTTSGKPGDIIELLNESEQELVYEVTTKEFSDDRMLESHESVNAYEHDITDVFVICRPADVPAALESKPGAYLMAYTQYKELAYYFINIYEYIQSALLFITPEARSNFYDELVGYVNDTNRSEKVKVYFKNWHEKQD